MAVLNKLNTILVNLLTFLGGLFLVGMIALTCANIFSRVVWIPIRGSFELMGYAGALVTAFALGYTQIKKGNIAVDILIHRYPDWAKRLVHIINSFICVVFFAIASWQISVKATTMMQSAEVTETLQIIYYPFVYAVAFGCAVLVLTLLTELLKAVFPQEEN
jgi:TRAP-type C4-dicarboxylate transport system permease small subunit